MAVTAQQIAELTGVSRGTVDRALHNRGRVNPDVAARIRQVAAELGYRPNQIGQALVKTPRDFRIGVILQSAETPTMQIVSAGVHRAADELRASRSAGWTPNWCSRQSKNWSVRVSKGWPSRPVPKPKSGIASTTYMSRTSRSSHSIRMCRAASACASSAWTATVADRRRPG